ncbi:MAG: DUF4263 domain-containing protein [Actinobacteria bacterium]|nr:DUF4263 domain-containing protein [Actinomycetota bacterium]
MRFNEGEYRAELQHCIETVFRVDGLAVDERLFQAVDVTDDPIGVHAPSSHAVLVAALAAYPVLGATLSAAGVDVSRIRQPHLRPFDREEQEVWDLASQLEVWFKHPRLPNGRSIGWSAAYEEVRSTGRLSVFHIVRACLETRYLDEGPRAYRGPFQDTNDLLGELGIAAGLPHVARDLESDRAGWQAAHDSLADGLLRALADPLSLDSDLGSQQFVLFHDGNEVRIRAFGAFEHVRVGEDRPSLWVGRGNVTQPSTRFSAESLAELEALVNGSAPERAFQLFFERHPEYVLALGPYARAHPQLVLHQDDGNLIPDFFVEKISGGLADIIDLKRADVELVRRSQHRNRFKDLVDEAVAQLTHYRDYFDDRINREAFHSRHGFSAFRPKVIVVVGRSGDLGLGEDRVRLESLLPTWVEIASYDDVIDRARHWRLTAANVRL